MYDEDTEVPLYETGDDLAQLIGHYLERDVQRAAMATTAHRRAVPTYFFDNRAVEILRHIRQFLGSRAAANSIHED